MKTTFSQPVLDILERIRSELASVKNGEVATYIPELAKANPDWFGICLVTATGAVYEVGDSRQAFTIQSISKPFVYGMALEDNGREDVLKKVGVEPSGDVFNSISLEPESGRPMNPMINAGAIATTGLVAGKTIQSRLKRMLGAFSTYAGRELELDEDVYRSESATGHRNRAIGHMLRNFDILTTDPMPIVESYFQQCSISVTCRDLGIMAATLANRGMNPLTGKQAIRSEYVESVLSVMESCGTYDFAGEWIYDIGLPAKSGVAGGIIAVLPGQLGIAVFSPPLDDHGNSFRGIRVCKELSRSLDLHQLSRPTAGRLAIRMKLTAAEFNSSRVRTTSENLLLARTGQGIKVYQLQGNLTFTTTESIVFDIMESTAAITHLILDFKRVLSLNKSACLLLYLTLEKLAQQGKPMLFVHTEQLPLMRRYMKTKLESKAAEWFRTFEDLDFALEWCEDQILEASLPAQGAPRTAGSSDYEFLAGMTAAEIAIIEALLKRRVYPRGASIINAGDEACELFFLASGNVSVLVTNSKGAQKRLATFSPGMAFGEMAVIDWAPRSAMIVADMDVECDLLALDDLEKLGLSHPSIKIKLLQNLSLGLCRKLRKANRELGMLE